METVLCNGHFFFCHLSIELLQYSTNIQDLKTEAQLKWSPHTSQPTTAETVKTAAEERSVQDPPEKARVSPPPLGGEGELGAMRAGGCRAEARLRDQKR